MHILLTTLLGLWPGVINTGQAQNMSADQQTAVTPQLREVNTGRVGQGPILVPLVHEVFVPFTTTPPTIDGSINLGSEWASAAKLYAGDLYGLLDGYPNDSGALIVYLMHDDNYLYLAYDCFGDNTFGNHSQPSIVFDDDNSHSYPLSPDTSEGANGIGNDNDWMCMWFYQDNTSSGWYYYGNTGYSFGTGTGHYQFEIRIPIVAPSADMGPAFLRTGPTWPDTVGALIYWYEDVSDYLKGWWPQDHNPNPWYACATFGDLILLPKPELYEVHVPYTSSPPTVDGAINPSEWADAVVIDVSDTMSWDGVKNNPGDCLLYIKHDNNFLYLGYDAFKDINMADHSQPSICLEDNADGDWPPPGNYSEGANGIGTSNGWYAMSRFNDGSYYGWYNTGLTNYAFGNATGHVQCEFGIPIVNPGSDTKPENLGAGPVWPDTIRVFIYYYDDGEPGAWIAGWPQAPGDPDYDGWWYPTYFGTWILDQNVDVSEGKAEVPLALFAPSVVRGGFGINLSLPGESDVRLALFDATGRLVSVIAEGMLDAGNHAFTANPGSGGVYILRADVNGKTLSEKVTVVK